MLKKYQKIFKNYKSAIENAQKIKSESTSTMVVMNGFATTAGSRWHFFASSGRHAPTILAAQIVIKSEIEITAEILMV